MYNYNSKCTDILEQYLPIMLEFQFNVALFDWLFFSPIRYLILDIIILASGFLPNFFNWLFSLVFSICYMYQLVTLLDFSTFILTLIKL